MAETETVIPERLLFNKWDLSEVQITDPGLVRYVGLNPVIVPHTTGKFTRQEFNKANMLIVERLINRLMKSEMNTGNKQLATRIVRDAFVIVHQKTKKNPVQVLVDGPEIRGYGPDQACQYRALLHIRGGVQGRTQEQEAGCHMSGR